MSTLLDLEPAACLALLALEHVGRVGIIIDAYPVVLPVNYQLAEVEGRPVIVLRTVPTSMIATHPGQVSFQLDGHDRNRKVGWSVLVLGRLAPVTALVVGGPESWLPPRDHWMMIEFVSITGRELVSEEQLWPFDPRGYL